MANGQIMSQDAIDKMLQEVKEQEEAKKLGIAPTTPTKKKIQCEYICAYCKRICKVEFDRVDIAPMIFIDNSKTNQSDCKNSCGHWYVSAAHLNSLKIQSR